MELLRLVKEGSTPSLSLPNSGLGLDASTFITWSLILMTTSQITSTATQFTSWKMKDGIKATLVESDINKVVRLHDGSSKIVKADRYVLIEWSPKLSLILEIPENHQEDAAKWVDEMNKVGRVNFLNGWGKFFPQAKQYDF